MEIKEDIVVSVDLLKIEGKGYFTLEKIYQSSEKPILLVGPYHCGKRHSVQALCYEHNKVFYEIDKVNSESDFLGYFNNKGEYQKSPLFMAYINGEILYIDHSSMSKENFNKLMDIYTSNSFEFPCGVFEKNKNFRLIISIDKEGYLDNLYSIKQHFEVIFYNYDETIEKKLCPDEELYQFLIGLRAISRALDLPLVISTETFKNSYTYSQISKTTPKDVIRSVMGNNFFSYILEALVIALKSTMEGNKYYEELKGWEEWKN